MAKSVPWRFGVGWGGMWVRGLSLMTVAVVGCSSGGGAPTDGGLTDAGADVRADVPYHSTRTNLRPLPPNLGNPVDPSNELLRDGEQDFFYETWGLEAYELYPPTDFVLELMRTDPLFQNQFERFGFIPDPNDDLPLGLKRGSRDPSRIRETCASCHTARLPDGRIWSGAPASQLDIEGLRKALHDRWVAAGNTPYAPPDEVRRQGITGPGRTRVDGANDPVYIPLDFPAIYDLGERRACNYAGTGQDARSEILLSLYGSGLGAPDPETTRAPFPPLEAVEPFIAYFTTRPPPPAPPQDDTLVAAGRAIFERERCGSCHASAVPDMRITPFRRDGAELRPGDERMWPYGTIATDGARFGLVAGFDGTTIPNPDAGLLDAGSDAAAPMNDYTGFLLFIIRYQLRIGSSEGYRQSDLRGVWQSAPYLHNGSVPTLEDLFRPVTERPRTFMNGSFMVEATSQGFANIGHEFATHLTASERAELVAYLRSL